MSIKRISSAKMVGSTTAQTSTLPLPAVTTYRPSTIQIQRAGLANPKNGNASAGLVGEFLSTTPMQAGILGRSSGPKSVSRKVYEAAVQAPRNVTYKKGDAHVFGYRVWTPGTRVGKYPGYNSCARVASAILKKAGVNVKMRSRVVRLESDLQHKGWKRVKVDDIKKGDVVIWKHKGGANHIGFYAGLRPNIHRGFGKTTVDNFSFTGEPEFRALNRETEWDWRIRKILRAPR